MNPVVEEWVRKAEGDFGTATREIAVAQDTNHDAVCFHYQQCIEKYLKAFLIAMGATFPKTHDLAKLLDLCIPFAPNWSPHRQNMVLLSRAAVEFRYPGDFADDTEAEAARRVADDMREVVRQELGIT